MQRPDLLASLVAITGDLEPSSETTVAELTDLRRALLESLRGEPAELALQSEADDHLLAELRYLVSQHEATPGQPGLAVRLVRRESPILSAIDPSLPDWAAALSPTRSFGPFLDRMGRSVWFDLFRLTPQLRVRRGAQGEDFLLLPFRTNRRPLRPGVAQTLNLPAGTVWIAARQFSALAPAGSYAGIRIKGGTLSVGRRGRFAGDVLILLPGETVTLRVTLDPPSTAGPATGPGAEATHAESVLPEAVTFVLTASGMQSVDTDPASLSVYANSFSLRRNEDPPEYDPLLRQVLIPLSATPDVLDITATHATLFSPSGSAGLTRSAWGLPASIAPPDSLGEASGAGYLVLRVGPGLQAAWQGLDGGPIAVGRTDILVDGVSLLFIGQQATDFRANQSFHLWQETIGVRSSVEVAFRRRFPLWFFSLRTGADTIFATGTATAHLDRPMAAGGTRIDNPFEVTYSILHRRSGLDLFLSSTQPPENARGPMALALTNALLTTTRPLRFSVNGPLTASNQLDSGVLNLEFGLYQLLPTLPDPYAANFTPQLTRDAPDGVTRVNAQVAWSDMLTPKLAVRLTPDPGDHLVDLTPPSVAPREQHELFDRFGGWLGDIRPENLALLDVSSNADQLGVSIGLMRRSGPSALTIQDLSLATPGFNVRVFLMPQFQWEPVRNLPNELTGDGPGTLFSSTDGGPTLVGADSVRLVPVAPIPVASEVVRAYKDDPAPAAALFTLPFGMKAVALLNRRDRRYLLPPELRLIQPHFTGLTGARQLSLRAGRLASLGPIIFVVSGRPSLDGATVQTDNITAPPGPNLGSVLGILRDDFNSTFASEVPLTRIDFSGYGANVFSHWVNDSGAAVRITQVAFDAFHGRTSYERIQLTSILWPCQATVVRTITLERYGSGTVMRWDNGWIATTPGLFHHEKAPNRTFHPSVVRGIFDIREIRDTDYYVDLTAGGSARVQAVYFDADIAIDGVERGQGSNRRVPARRQLGFIQRIPLAQPISSMGVGALTPAQLKELFDLQGPIGGPIDCTIRIGNSQQKMRVTGVFADNAGINPDPQFGNPQFAVAVYGNPALPASGQWSVVRVRNNSGAVEPVNSQRGVPLIREGKAADGPAGAKALRWADPAHLFQSAPDADYALLFSSDTQRLLYARPKIEATDTDITSSVLPQLADPYALLRSGGLFPRVSDAIPFDQTYPLSVASGQLKLVPGNISFPALPSRFRQLVDTSTWFADATYDDGAGRLTQFFVDSAQNWTIDVKGVSQVLKFDPIGEIMRVVHDIHSPADAAPSFPNPAIHFSGLLEPVSEVFDLLRKMVPDGNLPGLPGPLQVSASFSGSTFRLAAIADFKVEGRDGEAIECGAGKLRGDLKIGAELSAEILKAKVAGAVFLEITGSYQQQVFPLIYGGGLLRFKIRADDTGKTGVELDACTVASVGGSLIPGLIDLEAGVKYGYYIAFDGGRFQPGFVVGMEGRAKLLSGLLGFRLTVEGRILVTRINTNGVKVLMRGDILVAGTVTAVWLVDERKSFHTSFNVTVDWKLALAAARAGLIPVPPVP